MWTVVFGPKVEFPLSNVDTKIQVLDFDVQITSALKKYCPQKKVSTVIMDTFSVDSSLKWTIPIRKLVWTRPCGHTVIVDTVLWTVDPCHPKSQWTLLCGQ